MERLICLLGLAVFVALAWAMSSNRRLFPWRTVVSGLALQVTLAWMILATATGKAAFVYVDRGFNRLLGFANEGAAMVFGPLANEKLMTEKLGEGNAFIFVITVTGTIILVSALSSLLYHYGILQFVVKGMAWVMRRVMGTSGS